jgi:hypothetical protein
MFSSQNEDCMSEKVYFSKPFKHNELCFRTGRLGRLSVHKLSKEAGSPKTSSSPVGSSVMGLGEKTDVFISGIPENYPLPSGLTSYNFTGCLGSVFIDDKLVGLYNFETNIQDTCKACLEV